MTRATMQMAQDYLGRIKELEKQIEQMQDAKCISCTDLGGMLLKITDLEKKNAKLESDFRICEKNADTYYDQLTKAKEIMNIAIEGIKHWGIVGGTERPFEKQAELEFNLFLEKAEQFLQEISE